MSPNRHVTHRDQWVGHERLEFTDLEGRPSWRAFSTKGDYTSAEIMVHPVTKLVSLRAAEFGAPGHHSKRGHLSEASVSLDEVASRELFLMLKAVYEPAQPAPEPRPIGELFDEEEQRARDRFEVDWPLHPDGSPKRVDQMTTEERLGTMNKLGIRVVDVSVPPGVTLTSTEQER